MNLPVTTLQPYRNGEIPMKPVGRMVGVTGIEPVTPTMSTSRPYGICRGLREEIATPQSIFVHAFDKRSAFQVRQTSGHYVAALARIRAERSILERVRKVGEKRRSRPLPLVRLAGEAGRP